MALTRTITAFNTATASENKMHDDTVASRFGFTGGLVPGVDVFGYLAHAPAALWGRDWLTGGAMRARFAKPVYDGDEATLRVSQSPDGALELSVSARGIECATGSAVRVAPGAAPALAPTAPAPAPASRPKASRQSLAKGVTLGTLTETYTAERGRNHLKNIREDLELYEDGAIANPAYLLRRANYVLASSVLLGPWIHVESDIALHGLLRDGESFEARAVVTENEESKGHLIVTLDFTISSPARLVMSGRHWAIYEPRQVREHA